MGALPILDAAKRRANRCMEAAVEAGNLVNPGAC